MSAKINVTWKKDNIVVGVTGTLPEELGGRESCRMESKEGLGMEFKVKFKLVDGGSNLRIIETN